MLFTNVLSQNKSKHCNERITVSHGSMKLFSYYFGQIESFKYYSGINIRRREYGKRTSADNFHFSSVDDHNNPNYRFWIVL